VIHTKIVEIRWSDIDGYRHVHHGAYVYYFEEARDEWLAQLVGDTDSVYQFLIRRLEVDYQAQVLHQHRAVAVTIQLEGFGTSSIRTHEQLRIAGSDTLIAEARCVLVRVDADATAAAAISDALRARLEAFAKQP
jgi:acyl-CoA thioester hydrolase